MNFNAESIMVYKMLGHSPAISDGGDILSSLIETNMFPAVMSNGELLTDQNGKIILM